VIASLAQQFKKLEDQRTDLLKSVSSITSERFLYQPKGKWSIAKILSHLVASEQLSVRYLSKKLQGIDEVDNTGVMEELKMLVLIISQRLPLKFKAPNVIVENTHVFQSLQDAQQNWDKTRNELKAILDRFDDNQIRRKVFKHPIAGKLNIQQTLRFIQEHIIHHTPQIKNLLKQK
jgi:uncharacterized damage-inducible protein DinB